MLPSSVDLYDLVEDPFEQNNVAGTHPDRVAAMQARLDELAAQGMKPLFLADQFQVVLRNMNGEPVMPFDEGFYADGSTDPRPPKIGGGH